MPASETSHAYVTRHFSLRWEKGLLHARIFVLPAPNTPELEEMIAAIEKAFVEAAERAGERFVNIVDLSALSGESTPDLMRPFGEMYRRLPYRPVRRAVLLGEGRSADSHGGATQVVTAGHVRLFRVHEIEAAVAYLLEAGTTDASRIRRALEEK